MVCLDESGLMLQPLVRRTWSPTGQTPVIRCWARHDRLSVIAALTLAPRRRRIGLYFVVQQTNVNGQDVVAFLRDVHRHQRRGLVVVLDRGLAHRKAARLLASDERFWIEWLPPYAPDLNPVEHVWNRTKYADLANYIADDLCDLNLEAEWSMEQTRHHPKLLRSFYHGAKLELWVVAFAFQRSIIQGRTLR